MDMRTVYGVGVAALLLAVSAGAAEPKRLIQDNRGAIRWLDEQAIMELSAESHAAGRCAGFMDLTDDAGVDLTALATRAPLFRDHSRALTQGRFLKRALAEVSEEELVATVTKLSSFPTRHHKSDHGVAAANWIRDRFVELAAGRDDVEVELFKHSFKQPSVIARVKGAGRLAAETIVVGGHEDSIRMFGGANSVAPGADDDASGTATVLEAFRILMATGFRSHRTIEFHTYAGEEAGLLGSQDIARSYREKGRQVVGMLQFDMTMYPGPGGEIHFVSDNVNAELTDFTIRLTEQYVGAPWKKTQCGYGCSDHASWTRNGFPSAFPFEAAFNDDNPSIHSADDLLDKLTTAHGVPFAKLAVAFVAEMGRESAFE
jgi:bacterial leucyl aminopeptidase